MINDFWNMSLGAPTCSDACSNVIASNRSCYYDYLLRKQKKKHHHHHSSSSSLSPTSAVYSFCCHLSSSSSSSSSVAKSHITIRQQQRRPTQHHHHLYHHHNDVGGLFLLLFRCIYWIFIGILATGSINVASANAAFAEPAQASHINKHQLKEAVAGLVLDDTLPGHDSGACLALAAGGFCTTVCPPGYQEHELLSGCTSPYVCCLPLTTSSANTAVAADNNNNNNNNNNKQPSSSNSNNNNNNNYWLPPSTSTTFPPPPPSSTPIFITRGRKFPLIITTTADDLTITTSTWPAETTPDPYDIWNVFHTDPFITTTIEQQQLVQQGLDYDTNNNGDSFVFQWPTSPLPLETSSSSSSLPGSLDGSDNNNNGNNIAGPIEAIGSRLLENGADNNNNNATSSPSTTTSSDTKKSGDEKDGVVYKDCSFLCKAAILIIMTAVTVTVLVIVVLAMTGSLKRCC